MAQKVAPLCSTKGNFDYLEKNGGTEFVNYLMKVTFDEIILLIWKII